MIFISSDLHIQHKNIASPNTSNWNTGFRVFNSLEEHDNVILNNINKYVCKDDTLYLLGDLTFKGKDVISMIFDTINCQNIHLLIGNHDGYIKKHQNIDCEAYKGKVKSISYYKEITIDGQVCILFHYPIGSWNKLYKGSCMLHGHCHDSYYAKGKILDVGIDTAYRLLGEYKPFSFKEIAEIINKKEIHIVDHHDENTN